MTLTEQYGSYLDTLKEAKQQGKRNYCFTMPEPDVFDFVTVMEERGYQVDKDGMLIYDNTVLVCVYLNGEFKEVTL